MGMIQGSRKGPELMSLSHSFRFTLDHFRAATIDYCEKNLEGAILPFSLRPLSALLA